MTALEVRQKRANARAAELAPIIAELQAAGESLGDPGGDFGSENRRRWLHPVVVSPL